MKRRAEPVVKCVISYAVKVMAGIILPVMLFICFMHLPAVLSKNNLLRINHSQCSESKSVKSETFTFKMKKPNRLYIAHSGAVFNCCIDSLAADVDYSKSHIVINEREVLAQADSSCLCTCRYDIDYEIPVFYGDYTLIIRNDNDSYLKSAEFRMKLDDSTDITRSIELQLKK